MNTFYTLNNSYDKRQIIIQVDDNDKIIDRWDNFLYTLPDRTGHKLLPNFIKSSLGCNFATFTDLKEQGRFWEVKEKTPLKQAMLLKIFELDNYPQVV